MTSVVRCSYNCIGQASTYSCRPRLSHSDKLLADLLQRKVKISGCFKNSPFFVPKQCQNQVNLKESVLALH